MHPKQSPSPDKSSQELPTEHLLWLGYPATRSFREQLRGEVIADFKQLLNTFHNLDEVEIKTRLAKIKTKDEICQTLQSPHK